jgi:hypothetical protein
MKYLKSYNLFESHIDNIEDIIKEILIELQDAGLQIEISKIRKDVEGSSIEDIFLEVRIMRPFDSPGRVLPDAPQALRMFGKYSGFFWYEVKDAIIRLNDWYYDFANELRPDLIVKNNLNFRMFRGGAEFGSGWCKPEDFDHLSDYISFNRLRIEIKL